MSEWNVSERMQHIHIYSTVQTPSMLNAFASSARCAIHTIDIDDIISQMNSQIFGCASVVVPQSNDVFRATLSLPCHLSI